MPGRFLSAFAIEETNVEPEDSPKATTTPS